MLNVNDNPILGLNTCLKLNLFNRRIKQFENVMYPTVNRLINFRKEFIEKCNSVFNRIGNILYKHEIVLKHDAVPMIKHTCFKIESLLCLHQGR